MAATYAQARRLGAVRAEALCLSFRGVLHLLADDPASAESDLRAALDIYDRLPSGSMSGAAIAAGRLASVLTEQGRLDEAWDALQQGIPLAEQSSMRAHSLTRLNSEMMRNRLMAGDLQAALRAHDEADRHAREHGSCVTCRAKLQPSAVHLHLALGDVEAAWGHMRDLEAYADDASTDQWTGIASMTRAAVHRAEGQLDRARADLEQARDHFARCGWLRHQRLCEEALRGPVTRAGEAPARRA